MRNIIRVISVMMISSSILFAVVASVSAGVYRWKDSQGQTHYSTTPPTIPVKNLEVKRNNLWLPYTIKSEPSEPEIRKGPLQAVVSYSKQNTIIIIPVTINNTLEKFFAVDTGASYTIITQEVATMLNLTPNPSLQPITLQTANGQVQAPLVNLESVTVGGLTTHNIPAAIHNLGGASDIAGLLGLNYLDRFKMTVDSTRSQLTLEPLQTQAESLAQDCMGARALVARGQSLKNNSEEEASFYRQAILLCPDLVEAHAYLGTVYYNQKDYQRAIEAHLEIIRLQPNSPQAHYNLGILYMLIRKFPLAKTEFQKTLSLDANHKQARAHLEQVKNY